MLINKKTKTYVPFFNNLAAKAETSEASLNWGTSFLDFWSWECLNSGELLEETWANLGMAEETFWAKLRPKSTADLKTLSAIDPMSWPCPIMFRIASPEKSIDNGICDYTKNSDFLAINHINVLIKIYSTYVNDAKKEK